MSTITTDLESIISCLQQGNIAAIPTETVYGLAGNAEDEQAIKKIYALKNRPLDHPLIMHVAREWDLNRWISDIPDYAQQLMERFWPGPLTLVMNCKPGQVSPLVNGGQTTLALRCPSHPLAQTLLSQLAFPLVAPSANPFGKISPTTAQHVQQSFSKAPLLILDGGRCQVGIESTIVAATNPKGYQILRHGVIDEAAIRSILPVKELQQISTIRTPGRLASHYQPEKPLLCFTNWQSMHDFCQHNNQTAYVLSFTKNGNAMNQLSYQLPNNPDEAAYELYFQLRQADQSKATLIVLELPPDTNIWQGVRERLLKAGTIFQG